LPEPVTFLHINTISTLEPRKKFPTRQCVWDEFTLRATIEGAIEVLRSHHLHHWSPHLNIAVILESHQLTGIKLGALRLPATVTAIQ